MYPLVQSLFEYITKFWRAIVLFYEKSHGRTRNFEEFREEFPVTPLPDYRDFRCIIFGNSENGLQFVNLHCCDFLHSSRGAEMTKPISTGISNKKMKGVFPAFGSERRNPEECIVVSGVEIWRNPTKRLVFIARSDDNQTKL